MSRPVRIALLACAFVVAGCGGDDAAAPSSPNLSVSSTPTAITLAQGASGDVAVSVTRDGFTGTIALSLEGSPTGVTGTFHPAALTGSATASTLTVGATSTAAAGTHPLTIRARGTGVDDRTASVSLVLTPAPAFTLAVQPATLALVQGTSGTATVAIGRTAFADAVGVTVAGAPAGVVATVVPASVSGASASLTLDVGAAAVPGAYTLTLTGRAPGLADRATALALTVAAASALELDTPVDPTLVIGQAAAVTASVRGPGPYTFSTVGLPLPDGLALNPATGAIAGTPTATALLTGVSAGQWDGIVVRVSNGTTSVETEPFRITIEGAPLPEPYAYMPFEQSSLDDTFGRTGTAVGNVAGGVAGAIGSAVRIGSADSYVRYPSTLSSRLNGKAAFTIATTLKTTSAGTMLFSLSDDRTHYTRAYLGMLNGRLELGGRSQSSSSEPYRVLTGNAAVNDGAFHTVVGVIDLSLDRAVLYLDGMPDGSRAMGFGRTTYATFTPADQNVLGHVTTLADSPVAPTVVHDEVALWDVPLSAAQAATVAWLARTGTSIRSWIGF